MTKEEFYQSIRDAGHVFILNADGEIDTWVCEHDIHNGPGCALCGDSWCHHCRRPVSLCTEKEEK